MSYKDKFINLKNNIQQFKSFESLYMLFLFILVACLFCFQQIKMHQLSLGADTIFHYNRIYEAYMQIKTGHFEYFISLFSFNQSGRIVNAFYGPLFTYMQGLLLLIAGNWFRYQVLSNIIIYVVASSSMYKLLRYNGVKQSYSILLSIIYLTTYSIQYWVIQQAFSGWALAFLPLALFSVTQLIDEKKINPLLLAWSVSLLVNIHLLTAVFFVLLYALAFLIIVIDCLKKKEGIKGVVNLIKNGLFSVIIFFILTFQYWMGLYLIYKNNMIKKPFINQAMGTSTITGDRVYMLFLPVFLILIISYVILSIIKKRIKLSTKYLGLLALIFLLLSTNVIPWQNLLEAGYSAVTIIQFPFRFFIFSIPLFLLITGRLLMEQTQLFKLKYIHLNAVILLILGVSIGYVQTFYILTENYARADQYLRDAKGKYIVSQPITSDELNRIKYSADKSLLLKQYQKGTPDYLPLIKKTKENKYKMYLKQIVLNETPQQVKKLNKKVTNKGLEITWESENEQILELPIVKYNATELKVNGKKLNKSDYQLSTIGVVKIKSKIGNNHLIANYSNSKMMYPLFLIFSSLFLITSGYIWINEISVQKG
ncbi:hypothetical protein [Atopobacter phocae]|uniref:hypothetical protein n=1 Tax=Atopobacter phocae TaxID=136492 RepID=UPI0004725FE6|nr:hypothetical protein [Atopobacter phocae]